MPEPTRTDRRRAQTRAALIAAAQRLLAEGRTEVSVQEITATADVGLGSFYNHFADKAGGCGRPRSARPRRRTGSWSRPSPTA